MADPLHFGDEDGGMVDLTAELEKAIIDDPLLGGGTAQQPQQRGPGEAAAPGLSVADPLNDPLSSLGALGPLGGGGGGGGVGAGAADGSAGSGSPSAAGFDPFAGPSQPQHIDPFATYGALGPPPAYSDAAAVPAAPPQQQQQRLEEQPRAAAPAALAASSAAAGGSNGATGSLDSVGGGADGLDAQEPPLAARNGLAESPITVEVKEPQKAEASGMLGMKGSYVTYLVATKTTLPGWSAPEVAVRRRFRDFVSLADMVKARYRGYFAPPRPEKNAVEGQRMTDAFIEERRSALQRYMQRLAAHPVIGRSDELKLFLETQGDLASNWQWQGLMPPAATVLEGTAKFTAQLIGRESKVVDPVAAAAPAARSKDLMRAMKEAAQGLRTAANDLPADEADLRRAKEMGEEMREALVATSRAAERVVDKLDRVGSVCNDLGLALFKVAKAEEAQGGVLAGYTGTLRQSTALVNDEKRAAAALVRLSKMMGRVTGRTAQELAPLHDYLGFMPAVIRGLTSREHALVTHQTLEADLAARQKALAELEVAGAKVFGGDKAKIKRADDLKSEIAQLELSITAARAEYERIRDINRAELERFGRERRAEYAVMVENFAATQVAACERVLEVWLQLAGEMGAAPAELAAIRRAAPRAPAPVGSPALLGTAPASV